MPQILRSLPRAHVIQPKRASARERGYGQRWETYSKRYRRKNPFCARCLERGRLTLIVAGRTGVVDHKWPVRDGGPLWDPRNHWGLCNRDHDGWKVLLENHARATGRMDRIVLWCDDPSQRPLLRGMVR